MLRGSVVALASRAERGAAMRSQERLDLTEAGVAGEEGRGSRRQVTLLDEASWTAATSEAGSDPGWMHRRANVLVRGIDLQALIGGELTPCAIMDEGCPGLHDALRTDCRGGVHARIVAAGAVRAGDPIERESARE